MALALLAALALGFGAAKLREVQVAAPVLPQELTAHFSGRVLSVDPAARGVRLVLGDLRSGAFADGVPQRARIAVRGAGADFHPGQGLSLTARLMPPPGPSTIGDGDFGRGAFFQGVGAVGFSFGAPIPAPLAADPGWGDRLADFTENLRESMTARIQRQLPGGEGAIASALITGQRGGIDDADEAALRDAGLAHMLSISGLHMALVRFGLFWLVRAVLVGFPVLALNHPIKKWAAVAALFSAAFYFVISGASASAARAFVMLAMMLVAILADRPALSMRNLALAAAILLLWRPESITDPGFQMSFAAVVGLIAMAEWEQKRQRASPHGLVYRYLRGIVLTSLVGSLATMPFAIFYFSRATHYAVLGNLLAMPVMGFWIMPMAAAGVIAMPFGFEALPLEAMGKGIAAMMRMSQTVSGLPGAVTILPSFPVATLVLVTLGGLWLTLWRGDWRWWGAVPMLAGIFLAATTPGPDMLVASDARTIAIRNADGVLVFPHKAKDSFAASRWLAREGDTRSPRAAIVPAKCDAQSCIAMAPGGDLIAMPFRPEALAEDCARADIVISAVPAQNCAGPKLFLDSRQIAAGGGYAITNGQARSVNDWRGARPWVVAKTQ